MSKRLNGGGVVGEELDERAAKRRKLPIDQNSSLGETPETTTQRGLELLETVKKTADKSGRLIAKDFLTLPNKRQLPDYYEFTKMPIALDTIEAKLKNRDFPNLSTLESYFKRMVTNAKEYNQKGSLIHEDAERLRKAISNYMTKHNPAYKTPGYVAYPTPLPGDGDDDSEEDADEEEDSEPEEDVKSRQKRSRAIKLTQASAPRPSATPARIDSKNGGAGFEGLTFQQAQEKIMHHLLEKKEFDDDDFAEFEPFIVLPSRKDYKDYYEVIPHPVALKDVQKLVRGVRGKSAATGISELKSWAAFEEEVSYIWKNAFHYNEDNSDFFKLAKEFQKYFYKVLGQAKAAVSEPPSTKLKLRVSEPTKITLKFGGKPSPADSPAPQTAPQATPQANTTNGTAANGTSRRNPFASQQSSSTPVPTDLLEQATSLSGSAASPTPSTVAPVKNEDARNSPAISTAYNGYRAPSQSVSTPGLAVPGMPPPTTPALANSFSQGGYAQSFNPQPQQPVPNAAFDSKWRQPGKDASDALITNLSLATHPGLNISRHFRLDVPPSATLAQQSITINLPSTHYYLQIKPTIADSLYNEKRQHKLFVTSGIQRLPAMPLIPGHPVDQRHPLFDVRLLPGVNKIDIELIAALPKGASKPSNGQDVELEKITIFANLLRA